MGLAETAKLAAELSLKGNFASQMKAASKTLDSFDAKLDKSSSRAYKAGQQIGTGVKNGLKIAGLGVGLIAANVALGLDSLTKLETVTKQTEAVIKSTGGSAGLSAKDIRDLANGFESLNAQMDDTAIQSGANVLLTFTAINKDAFKPALEAALNLSTAMGQDLQTSVVQVGKALNDPVKGLTALSRIGVRFTQEQKDQILGLVGTGNALKNFKLQGVQLTSAQEKLVKSFGPYVDTLEAARLAHIKLTPAQEKAFKGMKDGSGTIEAQKVILAELDKEFGKSFLSGGQTTAGKVAKFKDSIDDLQRALATALLPAIGKISDALSKWLSDPATQKAVSDLGEKIASLFSDQNITAGVNLLKGFFKTVQEVAPALESAATITGKVVKEAVGLFKSLPPELQALIIGGAAINKLTGGIVTNIAGGLISAVLSSFKGAMNVTAGVVNVTGLTGGLGGAGGGAGGAAAAGLPAVAALVPIASAVAVTVISSLPFIERNNQLKDQGLNPAEIAALKYYQSDQAAQQQALKHLGYIPKKSDFESAMAKLSGRVAGVSDRIGSVRTQDGRINDHLTDLLGSNRIVASRAALTAAETRRVKTAVDRKNLSVKVTNSVAVSTVIDGRKYKAAINRDNVIVNGKERT